jgi:uncharacterized membrane protein (DUF441 family)
MKQVITALAIALIIALLTIAGAAVLGVEAPVPVAAVVGVVAAASYLARVSPRVASGDRREEKGDGG